MFGECGLKVLDGDERGNYRYDENGNLDGMVSSHVDDFILAGSDAFLKKITWKITEKLEISKLKDDEFRYFFLNLKKIKHSL